MIEGVRGWSYKSDIAFDNLRVVDEPCLTEPPSAIVGTSLATITIQNEQKYPADGTSLLIGLLAKLQMVNRFRCEII